jgi:hypothetical protein
MRIVIAFAALALATTAAFAGSRSPQPVSVTLNADNSGSFRGNIGDARASTDANQEIGCTVGGSTVLWAYCTATQADGRAAWCLLNSPQQLQAVAAIGPLSTVSVSFDKYQNCTQVEIDNYSYNRPVTP